MFGFGGRRAPSFGRVRRGSFAILLIGVLAACGGAPATPVPTPSEAPPTAPPTASLNPDVNLTADNAKLDVSEGSMTAPEGTGDVTLTANDPGELIGSYELEPSGAE